MKKNILENEEDFCKELEKHKGDILDLANYKIEQSKELFTFFAKTKTEEEKKNLILSTLANFRATARSKGEPYRFSKEEYFAVEEFGTLEDWLVLYTLGVPERQRVRIFKKVEKSGHKEELRHALACHNAVIEKYKELESKKYELQLHASVCALFTTLHDTQKATEILTDELASLIPEEKQSEVDKILKRYNQHGRPYGNLVRTERGDFEDTEKKDTLLVALGLAEEVEEYFQEVKSYKTAFAEFIAENNAITYIDAYTKLLTYEILLHPYQLQEQYVIRKGKRKGRESVFRAYEDIEPNEKLKNEVKRELYRIYNQLAESYT